MSKLLSALAAAAMIVATGTAAAQTVQQPTPVVQPTPEAAIANIPHDPKKPAAASADEKPAKAKKSKKAKAEKKAKHAKKAKKHVAMAKPRLDPAL